MNEQQLVDQLLTQPSDFLSEFFFSIVEETVSQDPLVQAVQQLDLNAQIRIISAINNSF
ncbi:hypothetical protein M595_2760 [Lyngbya aestuarii BL J]|uniref:Uncharacterized protein n=1 Tax=Lyngbya aestuarii BL J TaxID=1348334 RepID=U7QE82_9CYAN|nr:hypothetical protein [Lyngbya aestuarii]ERT03856.1 hypothetical protein M595_6203 [Lyngbya aestuarii BL J]ERT06193.1 hypothetical protein M595_3855 [Lyngbya aestuarii BL J]ERT07254.1 hypothetical protein M595_2760 [Lyngbya aestuarii BL J]